MPGFWRSKVMPSRSMVFILADETDDFAQHLEVALDGAVPGVGRLEGPGARAFLQALDHPFLVDQGDDDLSILGEGLTADLDQVPFQNPGSDHAVALDPKDELRAAQRVAVEDDVALDLL